MITEAAASHPLIVALREESSSWLVAAKVELEELTIEVQPDRVVHVCRFLKNACQFERISTVTAVDRYPMSQRFEVVYHLHSISRNQRVRLKTRLREESAIVDSVTSVWAGAGWYEREVYDLFGISFRNHPDLTRILMPHDWQGHPLRKDYPVHGHRYDYMEPEGGSAS